MIEIKEGFWYYGMFLMPFKAIPGHPHGGDMMGCLFRKEDEPESWEMVYRMRYYTEENGDPWVKGKLADK